MLDPFSIFTSTFHVAISFSRSLALDYIAYERFALLHVMSYSFLCYAGPIAQKVYRSDVI
jgi:hypothetical protein